MAETSMDDILNEKEPEEGEKEPEKQELSEADKTAAVEAKKREYEGTRRAAQRKEWEAQGRDPETGQFVKKEEKDADAEKAKAETEAEAKAAAEKSKPEPKTVEEMTSKEKAAFAKAADETRKRQVLEQRLRELEAKQQQPTKEAPQTFWDDPDAALKNQHDETRKELVFSRLNTSEMIARFRHKDFDEKLEIFRELVMTVPGLAQQMLASPDPAEFTYRTAASHKALKEVGGLDAMLEKTKKETELEVRAKLEEELKAKAEALAKERAALPGSDRKSVV